VRRLIGRHLSGQTNASQKLWNLLCLEVWHQQFIDPPSFDQPWTTSNPVTRTHQWQYEPQLK